MPRGGTWVTFWASGTTAQGEQKESRLKGLASDVFWTNTVMNTLGKSYWFGLALALVRATCGWAAEPLSPAALIASPDGARVYVACNTAGVVETVDLASGKVVASIPVSPQPSGLALSAKGDQLFVTCAAPVSEVCVVTLADGKIASRWRAGHTAMAPVVSPDGKTLFVCNRFNNDISVLDTATGKELRRIPVIREPVAAAVTPDGKSLLVANHLPAGRADQFPMAAAVSVVDIAAGRAVKELKLINGSGSLQDIRVSPDAKYAVVSHILGRFGLPATQLDRGWMSTNALTILALDRMEILNTVLLDDVDRGAANPWGIGWTANGQQVVVAHAGTHELSVIDFKGVLERLDKLPESAAPGAAMDYSKSSHTKSDVPNDLAFLVGLRQRIRIPEGDLGPRSVAVAGHLAVAGAYFSDTLVTLDLNQLQPAKPKSMPLGPKVEKSLARQGEFYFHDAGICFQGWHSCASCHPGQGRVDALNWDLLNDGIGNPKNNKSLLLVFQTPPAMSTGIRDDASAAVRAGIRHILFTEQPPVVADSIDAWLKTLQPVPSPLLEQGKLSAAAKRGEALFQSQDLGCADCHPGPLFTDLKHHDVGTAVPLDRDDHSFDTPALVELWRTAPYLHDGSAPTVRDVVKSRNPKDEHGRTSHLAPAQIDDLVAYLLSL